MPESGNVARPTLTSLRRILCIHFVVTGPLRSCGIGGSKMGRAVNLSSLWLAVHRSSTAVI